MKRIYIAGPFRGSSAWNVELNIRAAETLAFEVARIGSLQKNGCRCMPLCPHTNTRFFDGTLTGQYWLDGTMSLLEACHAAVFTPDWKRSEGAVLEHQYCKREGLEVFLLGEPGWEKRLQQWLGGFA